MSRKDGCRESDLVARIIAALRAVPGCVVRKWHGTTWGIAGDLDLYGSINGCHFEIEVKRPGEQPTRLQEVRLAQWRKSGALVGVAQSVEDALAILNPRCQRRSEEDGLRSRTC